MALKEHIASTPTEVLCGLALRRALDRSTRGKLRRGTLKRVIIEVPDIEWVLPMSKAAKALSPGATVLTPTADHSDINVVMGRPGVIISVSHAPNRVLPPALIAICDQRIRVGMLTPELVKRTANRCLRGRIAQLDAGDIAGLSLQEIGICFCVGDRASQALWRLRKLAASKCSQQQLPSLEQAQGYGEASSWAADLKIDIVDLRAGRIGFRDIDRGAILAGPPGTGKSTFAGIVAQACNLPLIPTSLAELFSSKGGHLGDVIKHQRMVFDRAISLAPSLLFIDELDAMPSRTSGSDRNDAFWKTVLTDFMMLLDSAISQREGVIVLGATNDLSGVDGALRRKGRLERTLWIGPPDAASLEGILRFYLAGELAGENLQHLVQQRSGATGADAEEWARSARRAARRAGRQMEIVDLRAAMLSPDPRSRQDLRRVAIHEAGHAVAALALGFGKLDQVSIALAGDSGGHIALWNVVTGSMAKSHLEASVVVRLAGRAAECALLGGEATSGAGGNGSSDLALATNMVAMWHTSLGMGGDLVWRSDPNDTLALLNSDPILRTKVNEELEGLYSRAASIVKANSRAVRSIARKLIEKSILSGDECALLMSATRKD